MRFYIQMLLRLRTTTPLPGGDLKFYFAFHDNTVLAPLPDVIKGSAFDLTAATFGTPGAAARDYQLVVETDTGSLLASVTASVTDAPATLSSTNGVSLSWPRYPGFTHVEIYVTVGPTIYLIGEVNDGSSSFNDVGQILDTVPSIPSVAGEEPQAYAETRVFEPTAEWVQYDWSIAVPSTYDFSKTTGKQWLRGGVLGLMGDGHQLEIDRIGISTGFGLWAMSDHDKNRPSLPSTSMFGSTQGPPLGGFAPSEDGLGGERSASCSTLETLVDICDRKGQNEQKIAVGQITQAQIRQGLWLVGRTGKPNKVTAAKIDWSDSIITIVTRNGATRRCSPSELWLVEDGPSGGTAARRLCEGMSVLTRKGGAIQASEIVQYSVSPKGEEVRLLSTAGDHVYWAGDAAAHNLKPSEI